MPPPAKPTSIDYSMMRRCIALASQSGDLGEYPYAAVICRGSQIVCESINRVCRDRDVTRHAEVVAISEAQRILGTTSLDNCAIYANAEPCAFCSYAIRETRIGRVVLGVPSPLMGGFSRWSILQDPNLSERVPEVFAPPPIVLSGFLQNEAEEALRTWNPLFWYFIRSRGIFAEGSNGHESGGSERMKLSEMVGIMKFMRRKVFDRIGRR
jgi:tRNA(adenine34) deaminase